MDSEQPAPSAPTDYYAVLGVPRDATQEEIDKAFHSQRTVIKELTSAESLRHLLLGEAYDVLKDPASRMLYDTTGLSTAEDFPRLLRRESLEALVKHDKIVNEYKKDAKRYGLAIKMVGVASAVFLSVLAVNYYSEQKESKATYQKKVEALHKSLDSLQQEEIKSQELHPLTKDQTPWKNEFLDFSKSDLKPDTPKNVPKP